MTTAEEINIVVSTINVAIVALSAVLVIIVYRWNDTQKKKDRAIDLYKTLMTSELLLKARLTSHEYLLEDPRNETYRKFTNLDFTELDTRLRLQGSQTEREARFLLRAIPNFFGMVDTAHRRGYLIDDEKIFSEVYAWYWVNIIENRQVPGNPMFTLHEWMTTTSDLNSARNDKVKRLSQLSKIEQ